MTKAEDKKRTERLIRLRRTLHRAESKIWLDAPSFTNTEAALNVLDNHLTLRLKKKFLGHNHIELKHSFWIITNSRHHMERFVNTQDVLTVFKQIIYYCNYWSKKYGQMVVTSGISSNPLE